MSIALAVTPDHFFENPLALTSSQFNWLSVELLNAFLGSREGVALMQEFVKIKDKYLQRTIAKLVAELETNF